MIRIAKITDAYVRHYSDTGQRTAYVEWIDTKGRAGRTEGRVGHCPQCGRGDDNDLGTHMQALFDRAAREGVEPRIERW